MHDTRRKILVVEDHEETRTVLGAALEDQGFHIQIAGDGLAALDVIAATPPDLILLDVGLPLMTGPQLLEQLVQNPAHARIPVIVITGATDYPKQCAHAVAFMRKPIDFFRLLRLVRYYVDAA